MKMALSRGVSMIELMVVVAIVAIATAIMAPMYVNYTSKSRLKTVSEALYNDFRRARSEALKTNSTVRVVFQSGSSWCYGLTTAGSCDCGVASACNLGQSESSDYSNTISDLALTGIVNSVAFEGDRGTASPAGTVTFTSSVGSISVVVNTMGSPEVCSSDIGDYEAC